MYSIDTLSDGEHYVEITTPTTDKITLDAIDISSTGILKSYGVVVVIKYLIQDGTKYKTIIDGILTDVCNSTDDPLVIEQCFLDSGMFNLSSWNNSLTSQIETNPYNIVIYKK